MQEEKQILDVKKEKKHENEMYAAPEQGIKQERTSDEEKLAIQTGESEEDVYSTEGREQMVEDGEISPQEAGFMEGANKLGQLGKDALTGEPLMGASDVVEIELDGEKYRFVNSKNAEKFREKKEKENE